MAYPIGTLGYPAITTESIKRLPNSSQVFRARLSEPCLDVRIENVRDNVRDRVREKVREGRASKHH